MMILDYSPIVLVFGVDLPAGQTTERYIRTEDGYSTAIRIQYLGSYGVMVDSWCSPYWLIAI